MPKPTKSTFIQLVIACFVVGVALTVFQVTPMQVVTSVVVWGQDLFKFGVTTLGTFFSYALLGAVLVIPIWLLFYLWGSSDGNESD